MEPHDLKKYSIRIAFSSEDDEFVARSPEFPAMTGFGETPEEAISDLHTVLAVALEIHEQEGYPIPDPQLEEDDVLPSGEFRVRIPRRLHYFLARQASDEGVSLNHLVSNALQDAATRYALAPNQLLKPVAQGENTESAEMLSAIRALESVVDSVTQQLPTQNFPESTNQKWVQQYSDAASIDNAMSLEVN